MKRNASWYVAARLCVALEQRDRLALEAAEVERATLCERADVALVHAGEIVLRHSEVVVAQLGEPQRLFEKRPRRWEAEVLLRQRAPPASSLRRSAVRASRAAWPHRA